MNFNYKKLNTGHLKGAFSDFIGRLGAEEDRNTILTYYHL